MNKKSRFFFWTVWLMLIAAIVFSSVTLLTGGVKLVSKRDYAILQRYKRLNDVYNILMDDYYGDLDEETLVHGAITGMTQSVQDEYTRYFTAEEMQQHDLELNGKYLGVGMLLQMGADGVVYVARVYENSPAYEAGMQVGDIITGFNGIDLAGIDNAGFDAAMNEIQFETGSTLTIQVLRNGETVEIMLVCREVVISNINSRMLDNNIGYIEIIQFGGNAVEGFLAAGEHLQDARALIIDVRDNPGGLLDDVLVIADELLDGGLIVYMEGKGGERENYYAQSGAWDIPVAVLVNESSASASEILAAAVQENDRGVVIGTQSYGKGIVQTLVTFEGDGAGLQYTESKYFTPDGHDIHQKGITPDIIVENEENDAQLACAIEYLLKITENNENDE